MPQCVNQSNPECSQVPMSITLKVMIGYQAERDSRFARHRGISAYTP